MLWKTLKTVIQSLQSSIFIWTFHEKDSHQWSYYSRKNALRGNTKDHTKNKSAALFLHIYFSIHASIKMTSPTSTVFWWTPPFLLPHKWPYRQPRFDKRFCSYFHIKGEKQNEHQISRVRGEPNSTPPPNKTGKVGNKLTPSKQGKVKHSKQNKQGKRKNKLNTK